MSVNGKLVADAAKKNLNENNFKILHGNNFLNSFAAIEKLSLLELKSVFFLLMDFIGIETYISLTSLSKVELQVLLQCRIQQISKTSCFGEQLIWEILGTMKKFKLLRTLGLCKHEFLQLEVKQSHIKPFWKLLYEICANLDDIEVQMLKEYFSLDNSLTYAEDILCHLYHLKIINEEEKFCKFIAVLKSINRLDLVNKINLYIEISRRKCIQVYNIRDPTVCNPCGLAIIVNQQIFQTNSTNLEEGQLPFLEERIASELDREKLRKLWTNFGFQTKVYNNLSTTDIERLFSDLPHEEHKDFDIFVTCLLSHGDKDVIYGSDCRPITIDSVINAVDKCTFLNGKPKLFFIQACQGQKHQQGVLMKRNNNRFAFDAVPEKSHMPEFNHNYITYSDVYKAVAVIEGYVSYRSPSLGSLFVIKLVEHLETSGDKLDLELIMKKVKAETAKPPCKQMPITSGTLRKSVIFKRLTI